MTDVYDDCTLTDLYLVHMAYTEPSSFVSLAAGERVAGVQREGERDGLTPQAMRENLDRILQFMAAKRIRMTHITSKEVAEGNLKSIMRVILALAAHYKPQSVKAASPHQPEPPPHAPVCAPAQHPATHGKCSPQIN